MVAPAENQNATLLIVDDDHAARERLREIFETAQYRVVTANEAAAMILADAHAHSDNGYKIPIAQTLIRRALLQLKA